MNLIEKNFTLVNDRPLFYRSIGSGPILILLHPSPRSSAMMEPLMLLLAENFTVIAPDTPGYGQSMSMNKMISSVYDYSGFIYALQQHLKAETILLYGSASGAQLAIAYALTYPKKVNGLFLDNAAHFELMERELILNNYFIDLVPKTDGSHLTALWNHVSDACLFFPWYDKKEENRIGKYLPPPELIQNIVNDYLIAGPAYADAYIAAFKHERAEKVQALLVPVTLFRWLGSPILKYIDALLKYPMPSNIRIVETPADMRNRYLVMKESIGK